MTSQSDTNQEKYPLTSQKGLSAEGQRMIDSFNHDQLVEHQQNGGILDQEQLAILKELKAKLNKSTHEEDYLNPQRFPLTTKAGLNYAEQRLLDEHGYERIMEAHRSNPRINLEQAQKLIELGEKLDHPVSEEITEWARGAKQVASLTPALPLEGVTPHKKYKDAEPELNAVATYFIHFVNAVILILLIPIVKTIAYILANLVNGGSVSDIIIASMVCWGYYKLVQYVYPKRLHSTWKFALEDSPLTKMLLLLALLIAGYGTAFLIIYIAAQG